MTIRSKLIANVLLTALIVVALSLAGFFSIGFLREKISYLTGQSTPFQVRALELQRELQTSNAALIKVATARTTAELALFRTDAEQAMERVRNLHRMQERMQDGSIDLPDELAAVARELFAATGNRIRSSDAAAAANERVLRSIRASSSRLDELDSSIHHLQAGYATAFAAALEHTGSISERLRSIEEVRNLVRELQLIAVTAQNLQNSSSALIARAKLNAVTVRIAKNAYYTTTPAIAAVTDGFAAMLTDYLRLQTDALKQRDETSRARAAAAGKELPYKLNDLFQTLDQETILAREELAFAAARQETSFKQSRDANDILKADSNLVELGLLAAAATNRLFTRETPADLDALAAEIRGQFTAIREQVRTVERSLAAMGAARELQMLRAAAAALDDMHAGIYAADGILSTLRRKAQAIGQADSATDRLHTIIALQTMQGNESVAAARNEQEQAVTAVNAVVGRSRSQIAGMGVVAIGIGIFFGFLIYRSVVPPLGIMLDSIRAQQERSREKAELASAIAGGDLDREVAVGGAVSPETAHISRDEVGMLLTAVVGMSRSQEVLDRALADMTASLRLNRDADLRRTRLQNGLHEFDRTLRGGQRTDEQADRALACLVDFLHACTGIIYQYDDRNDRLHPLAAYAVADTVRRGAAVGLGEGLAGQVALERKPLRLSPAPAGYLPVSSALGSADPLHIVILPILHNDILTGVLELGSFRQFTDNDLEFLQQALEALAVTFAVGRSRRTVAGLPDQDRTGALSGQEEPP